MLHTTTELLSAQQCTTTLESIENSEVGCEKPPTFQVEGKEQMRQQRKRDEERKRNLARGDAAPHAPHPGNQADQVTQHTGCSGVRTIGAHSAPAGMWIAGVSGGCAGVGEMLVEAVVEAFVVGDPVARGHERAQQEVVLGGEAHSAGDVGVSHASEFEQPRASGGVARFRR